MPTAKSNGFLNINKPLHMTSHDVVARVRRILRRDAHNKKVGHAGTLDPLASGVLILCLNQATRLSDYVMHTTKTYRAQMTLGIITDTYDAEGQVVSQIPVEHITLSSITNILPQFTGTIQQIPPMYSAIKQGGRKLYELAREGKVVERPPREITIDDISILDWQSPIVTCDITCSSGTYIRSLAHDIGQALHCGAYLSGLVRLQNGAFPIDEAIDLDPLLNDPHWYEHIISPYTVLQHLPSLTLTPLQWQDIKQGRSIPRGSRHADLAPEAIVMAYSDQNQLLAILRATPQKWKPHKVFGATS